MVGIPQEILIKMQQPSSTDTGTVISAKPNQSPVMAQQTQPDEDVKYEYDKTSQCCAPDDGVMKTLSNTEFEELVLAMRTCAQDRAKSTINTLHAQLSEHQALLNRLEESETERKKLAEHNRILGKMNCCQNERLLHQDDRIHALEAQVIALKLEVANEKGMTDHANLKMHQLTSRNKILENENRLLRDKFGLDGEDMSITTHRLGSKIPSSDATKSALSSRRSRRASIDSCLDLFSSIRTNYTEVSTASEVSATSESVPGFSLKQKGKTSKHPSDSDALNDKSNGNQDGTKFTI